MALEQSIQKTPYRRVKESFRLDPAPILLSWIDGQSKATNLDRPAVVNSLLLLAYAEGLSLVPEPKFS